MCCDVCDIDIFWYSDIHILWYFDIDMLWYLDIHILWCFDIHILWYFDIHVWQRFDIHLFWYADIHIRVHILVCWYSHTYSRVENYINVDIHIHFLICWYSHTVFWYVDIHIHILYSLFVNILKNILPPFTSPGNIPRNYQSFLTSEGVHLPVGPFKEVSVSS